MGDGRPMSASPAPHGGAVEDAVALGHADGEADQVELARFHGARVLGHLAADQRAAGLAAALGHAGDELLDVVGVELADGDVVEEEQRLGAGAGDVVDAHGHQVDADGLEHARLLGDQRLGADAVGGRDQHRMGEPVLGELEQPAEPADVADDLGPERGADVVLDALGRPPRRRRCRRRPLRRSRPSAIEVQLPERRSAARWRAGCARRGWWRCGCAPAAGAPGASSTPLDSDTGISTG